MKYFIYQDSRGRWRWYLNREDGERLATGEAYMTRADCEAAIARAKASFETEVQWHSLPPPRFLVPVPLSPL